MTLFLHVGNCIGRSPFINSWIATSPCKNERISSELSTSLFVAKLRLRNKYFNETVNWLFLAIKNQALLFSGPPPSVTDIFRLLALLYGLPSGGASGKEPSCQCRRGKRHLIPGLGRSPGGGHGNPLQYSCLKNPMDRGAWWATLLRLAKSWTWLSD